MQCLFNELALDRVVLAARSFGVDDEQKATSDKNNRRSIWKESRVAFA